MKIVKFNMIKSINSIYFFWIGVFLLASAPILASFFFLIASLPKIKLSKFFLKDNWNYPLLIATLIMIIGAFNIKLDSSFLLLENDSWDSNLLILGLFNWLPFFWFFWVFESFLKSKRQRYICAVLLIASTVPVLLTGYAQYFFKIYGPFKALGGLIIWYQKDLAGNISGMTGLFNNPNYTAAWLYIVSPFAISFIKLNKNRLYLKFISIFLFISIIIGMILTYSRSAFGCVVILLFLFNFVIESSKTKKLINLTILFSFLSLIIINYFGFINLVNPLEVLNRNFENLDLTRIDIWRYTLENTIKRPLFGWGSGSFPFLIRDITSAWKGHPHNILLELFFNYGIIVGLLLSFFVLKILIISFKNLFFVNSFKYETLDKIWFSSVLILIISQMVDIQYFDFRISFSFWILLAGLKNICISKEAKNL